jgi:hypothetical protein
MGIKTDNISSLTGGSVEVNSQIDFNQPTNGVTIITWLGEWNGGGYDINQGVSYSGSSYICIQSNSGYQPDSYPQFWQLVASKGQDGVNGSDGSQGPQGEPGSPGNDGAQGPQGEPGQNGGIADAPSDGNNYLRRDAGWLQTFPSPPTDGNTYVLKYNTGNSFFWELV